MIQVYDPRKKDLFQEEVSGQAFLSFLYENPLGKLPLEILVKRRLFQGIMGGYANSPMSKSAIGPFVEKYHIDLEEALIPPGGFASFNDFFSRSLKPTARSFEPDPRTLASPGDGRLLVQKILDESQVVQAKGLSYDLQELLGTEFKAQDYVGGTLFCLRLNPTDYHRYHYPCDGVEGKRVDIKGFYYSVNPLALKTIPKLYLANKRRLTALASPIFGPLIFIAIGATSVGSIVDDRGPGPFKKGEGKGTFLFGGSTILLLVPPPVKGQLLIPEDLSHYSAQGIEVKVLAGDPIGKIQTP